MHLTYNDKDYEIVIERKKGQRNTYIRVNKQLQIKVTTNYLTSMRAINDLIRNNTDKICDMIDEQEIKKKNNSGFFYLGKQYVVIYCNDKGITFSDDKVYINHDFDIDAWYKKQAKVLFQERLDYNY